MKLLLHNTPKGLKPVYNSDYEEKKKLKMGEKYWAKITVARNYENHKRFFAMLDCAWYHMPESKQRDFDDENHFRYQLMIDSGHGYLMVEPVSEQVYKVAKSISFENMDEAEFRQVFSDVLTEILDTYIQSTRSDFFNAIMEFM